MPFEGGTGTDTQVEIGGDGFIPGFAEQLQGARPGESRTINVTFPENYGKADLAGKAATFDITVKQISTQIIPEADDDLAKKIGAPDLNAVREIVTTRQQQEYDGMSRMRLKKALLDALSKMADFPVPPSIADQEFDGIWRQFEAARKAGTQDEEDKAKDEDTLKSEYRAIAERRVRLGLLLAEIGRINSHHRQRAGGRPGAVSARYGVPRARDADAGAHAEIPTIYRQRPRPAVRGQSR